ncbi:MAG: 50S ribosomal protein L25/general stress protein Ctc [Rhizobiales bacterium 24-66-13]|jgi:large subunit ribosomal protein L25|uniref:50S ribosomal protein L25/general stress protein Ctc n=1 Tax=Roseixanthobacter finlandensis TaxID=3119922 RepID=UPI000BC54961|nr:MAG: 50S ribosomal protein L25/general stress protein Ctc [Rhizobiales bacterium 35-66-30]OYZ75108.1 MAG: 50S ribosomal protein L25/general stress protein Ctc [Rhizobiales bacterium 24-66-13]OZA96604.1 MAG: 50S ribosomal protein L25/general stress protein Ctc [Rhizobiales bacterium 39-66-18]HQS09758.1 50S ribosomal protein L25/general stress protein Ctc [Xanthobacteraceae bacterium]HQS48432.1 50S ribosomal protein L25/general stress protein Ctc [Xanthobacteraceae bacterium]
MTAIKELKAVARERAGKGAAREERRAGRVPAVIYGEKQDPITISLEHKEITRTIYAGHFLTTLFLIEVDGKKHRVIPRDYQLDPVKDLPLHVDFLRVSAGARVTVEVPVHFVKQEASPGLKAGGTLNIVHHAVELDCPAESIPDHVSVDMTGVQLGASLHLSSITLPEGVVSALTGDDTLATVVAPSGLKDAQADDAAAAAASAAATSSKS